MIHGGIDSCPRDIEAVLLGLDLYTSKRYSEGSEQKQRRSLFFQDLGLFFRDLTSKGIPKVPPISSTATAAYFKKLGLLGGMIGSRHPIEFFVFYVESDLCDTSALSLSLWGQYTIRFLVHNLYRRL